MPTIRLQFVGGVFLFNFCSSSLIIPQSFLLFPDKSKSEKWREGGKKVDGKQTEIRRNPTDLSKSF
jgi:hypothetical protein